jgi:hypothetical protein
VIGGVVLATSGDGIMPLSKMQMVGLGLALLMPTVLIALLLVRRGPQIVLHRNLKKGSI